MGAGGGGTIRGPGKLARSGSAALGISWREPQIYRGAVRGIIGTRGRGGARAATLCGQRRFTGARARVARGFVSPGGKLLHYGDSERSGNWDEHGIEPSIGTTAK